MKTARDAIFEDDLPARRYAPEEDAEALWVTRYGVDEIERVRTDHGHAGRDHEDLVDEQPPGWAKVDRRRRWGVREA